MTSTLNRRAVREAALPNLAEQYRRLGETGIIEENTELLRDIIFRKRIKSPQHSWFVQKPAIISAQIGPSYSSRQEQPISLSDSEPENPIFSFDTCLVCDVLPAVQGELRQFE